jgi:biotin carboxyl carrier protein
MSERLVVSPTAGLFEPDPSLARLMPGRVAGAREPVQIDVGGLIGLVGKIEVRSAFRGSLEGVLVLPGERVTKGQPVAWLRASAKEG